MPLCAGLALATSERRIKMIDKAIEEPFEANISGKVSDERFVKMTDNYEKEQKELLELVADGNKINAGCRAKQGGFEAADEGTSGLHGHPAAHPGDCQCADTAYRSPQQGQKNKKGEGGHLPYCRRTVHPADGTGAADGDGGDTPKPAAVRNFCIKQNTV